MNSPHHSVSSEYSDSLSYLSQQGVDSSQLLDSGIMEEDESSFTVLLEAHDKDPWGASVNFDDDWKEWRVKTVDPGQQAWRKCVESGFRILSVNGMPLCPKPLPPIRDILSNGRRCEVEFDTNTRGSLFTPKQARKWRLNSLENEETAMSAAMARMIRTHSSQVMESEDLSVSLKF